MTAAVRRAALLVAVEGVALLLLGVGYGVAGLLGRPAERLGAVLGAVLAVALGGALLPVARALDRARPWSRSPVVVVNLFCLPVGYSLAQGGVWPAAVVVLGLSLGVLYLLAAPEARLAFRPDGPGRG